MVATRAGWIGRAEVVELQFDPKVIGYADLVRAAQKRDCAGQVFAVGDSQLKTARKLVGRAAVPAQRGSFRLDKEPKYYLLHSPYRHVPMTELQAVRINAALGKKKAPAEDLLSPRQRQLLARVQKRKKAKWPVAVGVDISAAWAAVVAFER